MVIDTRARNTEMKVINCITKCNIIKLLKYHKRVSSRLSCVLSIKFINL